MKRNFSNLYSLDKIVKQYKFYYSLDPQKIKATLPSELAKQPFFEEISLNSFLSLESIIIDLFSSQNENFPTNIFWDMDGLISFFLHLNDSKKQKNLCKILLKLYDRYGNKKSINFAYIHDFIYGFDWYRWVKKDFFVRKNIGPYDFVFLDYLNKRSLELFELIKINDHKYSTLCPHVKRNPFSFRRTVEEEIKIHLKLACKGAIPWKAWILKDKKTKKFWETNFSKIRQEMALEIR